MKINVKQVLSDAVVFYKGNFKFLAGLSFFITILTLLMQIAGYLPTDNLALMALLGLVFLAAAILVLAVLPKLYMAMMILINSLLDEKEMRTDEAYRQTKGKYWVLVGCSLLVGLMLIPGTLLVYFKIPFAGPISSLYYAFIFSFFYVMIPMIAIEPKTSHYLSRSSQMIIDNYPAALALNLITSTLLTVINGTLIYIFQGNNLALITVTIIYSLLYFFIYPFASTVTVIVYRQLAKTRDYLEDSRQS